MRIFRWLSRTILLGLAATGPFACAQEAPSAPAGTPLAWIRFEDGPEKYAGRPYVFLGEADVRLKMEVRPQAGQAIDLLWGAKGDQRSAVLSVNGRDLPLEQGGYEGFRWLRVALPADLAGERHDVLLKSGGAGKPAFLAEVRLVSTAADAGPVPDLAARSSKVVREAVAVTRWIPRPGEAFPEMRALWDGALATNAAATTGEEALFQTAERHGRLFAEGLYRCRRYVDGWLAHADPVTGLIPRNLRESRDFWNGRDAAADNYPFMVLTAALTDRALFEGRMREMLKTEARVTARIDRLPDAYSFSTKAWRTAKPDLDAAIFDGAEYVKDGLLPITEWLGASPWSERMIGIMDDIWKNAQIETPFGKIPTKNFEVNGDLLQACARLYWFTGDRKYLDWAIRLGDYYLLGNQHPTRDMGHLALSDHSCEVINGLSELYVAVAKSAPEKREAYRAPLHELYDRVLEIGCNEHGLMYAGVNTRTGAHSQELTDNWGYNYDGIYTAWLVDGTERYRDAVRKVLGNLKAHYTGQVWQGGSADGYADSIEGALTLFNREPIPSAGEWIDSEIRTMWAKQKADGVIEGWHGDGNFARTTIMYVLWKTQGAHIEPWRADVRLGVVRGDDGRVFISLAADQPWEGRIIFDQPRHRTHLRLPLDYPRINQFPEWFAPEVDASFDLRNLTAGSKMNLRGRDLWDGIRVALEPGKELRLTVTPVP